VVRLRLEDLAFSDAGIIVTLRKSKTDQEAEGREVGLPWGQHSETCPVRALRRWLDIAAIEQGYQRQARLLRYLMKGFLGVRTTRCWH
jgi:hypothetical protein